MQRSGVGLRSIPSPSASVQNSSGFNAERQNTGYPCYPSAATSRWKARAQPNRPARKVNLQARPLGDRAFVVAAGPAVNLIFGILVYWLVFATGINSDSARLIGGLTGQTLGTKEPIQIGGIAPEGAGAKAGLMPGDTVLAVNGDPITHWAVFHTRILTSADRELEVLVERDGTHRTLYVTPEAVPSTRGDIGIIKVSAKDKTVVRDIADGSLAAQADVQVGDLIETINGEPIHNVPYFGYGIWHPSADWSAEKRQALYQHINENEQSVMLGIRRGDEARTIEMPVHWSTIASVQENSIAAKAGIQNGDVLATLNGEPIDNTTLYSQLNTMTREPIVLNLIRDGNLIEVSLVDEFQISDPDAPPFGLAWQTALSGIQFTAQTPPLPEYDFFCITRKRGRGNVADLYNRRQNTATTNRR